MTKTITNAATMILGLQDEIRRSPDARYDHRLHGILLVAQGMSAPEVGRLLGDSPRTVQYWVDQFEREGLGGLIDKDKAGRPGRLGEREIVVINKVLREPPSMVGFQNNLWDGKTLSAFIDKRFGIELKVRQCQRLFRQLDFRLRKPRPIIANADPEEQQRHKKTPKNSRGSDD
jgi:transposase